MSLSLFNAVPEGAIETVLDGNNKLWFKRANFAKYLKIANIRDQFGDIATETRYDIVQDGVVSNYTLNKGRNWHDAFVDLDGALEIVVRSKAVELTKWLALKSVEKVIEEKDSQLALLNDDLTESGKMSQMAHLTEKFC